MAQSPSNNPNVFINGKEQVVDLLKALPTEERDRLLANMRIKNPALTNELARLATSFEKVST